MKKQKTVRHLLSRGGGQMVNYDFVATPATESKIKEWVMGGVVMTLIFILLVGVPG